MYLGLQVKVASLNGLNMFKYVLSLNLMSDSYLVATCFVDTVF